MTRRLISSCSPYEEEIGYSRAVVDGDWVYDEFQGSNGVHTIDLDMLDRLKDLLGKLVPGSNQQAVPAQAPSAAPAAAPAPRQP